MTTPHSQYLHITRNIVLAAMLTFNLIFPQSESVAVLDLEGRGVSQTEAASLTDRLRTSLVRTGTITVVERGQMQQILSEQDFQLYGCTSNECVVEVGQLLGVSVMIAGSIGRVGSMYSIDIRIIDVQTGKIIDSIIHDYQGEVEGLLAVMGEIAIAYADRLAAPAIEDQPADPMIVVSEDYPVIDALDMSEDIETLPAEVASTPDSSVVATSVVADQQVPESQDNVVKKDSEDLTAVGTRSLDSNYQISLSYIQLALWYDNSVIYQGTSPWFVSGMDYISRPTVTYHNMRSLYRYSSVISHSRQGDAYSDDYDRYSLTDSRSFYSLSIPSRGASIGAIYATSEFTYRLKETREYLDDGELRTYYPSRRVSERNLLAFYATLPMLKKHHFGVAFVRETEDYYRVTIDTLTNENDYEVWHDWGHNTLDIGFTFRYLDRGLLSASVRGLGKELNYESTSQLVENPRHTNMITRKSPIYLILGSRLNSSKGRASLSVIYQTTVRAESYVVDGEIPSSTDKHSSQFITTIDVFPAPKIDIFAGMKVSNTENRVSWPDIMD